MGGQQGPVRSATPWSERHLVGRDEMVAELAGMARGAATGSGCVVLLTGEAGIGKTSIARAVTHEARGVLDVHWGVCSAESGAPPFWPWRELLDLGRPSPRGSFDTAVGSERFEMLTERRGQLLLRAEPLLVVLEDLQWADVASVLLLAEVGAAISDSALMVVATYRTGEMLSPQLHAATDDVRRVASVRPVPPLGSDAVASLLHSITTERDPELAAMLHARTGGNPLYVTELVRATQHEESMPAIRSILAGSVPLRVGDLIAARLARLPEAVAHLTITAAVVGSDGDVRTLAAIEDAEIDATVDLLEQARAARLLDAAPPGRWRFRHDLVRDAVYTSLGDVERARRHEKVLVGLASIGSPPAAVLAHHALAAQPFLDLDQAVGLATQAGEDALQQRAYEEAAVWFGRALEAAPPGLAASRRAELLVLLGEAKRHVGDLEPARRAFLDAAATVEDPALLARAALGYASPGADLGIAYRGEDPVPAALLERAIGAQGDESTATVVSLETRLAAELYFSQPERARDLAESARTRAAELDDLRPLVTASAVYHDAFVVGQADLEDELAGSEQLLQWALASGEPGMCMAARRARVIDLLAAGDLAGVDAEIAAFGRLAGSLRVPGYLWWPALWSAMRALLDGQHDLAEQRATEAVAFGQGPFPSLAFANLSFLLFFLRREQGRLEELVQMTRDFAAAHAEVPALRVGLLFLWAELGRIDEARGLLTALSAEDLGRLHDRNWPASWFQLARAAFVVGDQQIARHLIEGVHEPTERCAQVSLATVCLGSTDLPRAWLLHTIGDLDAADQRYRSAADDNARIGARSWLAQVRADHARLLLERRQGSDVDEAERLFQLATEAATDIGLAPVIDEVERLRSAARADPSPPAGEPPVTSGCSFHRTGDSWEIDFARRAVRLSHTRGLSDLAFLLARPHQAVSVIELSADNPNLASGGRGAPALDERARREIRARLHELDDMVAEAEANNDLERAAAARDARQELAEAVTRDLGLGGRSRQVDDPVERARKTVSTRIRRTIATVGRAHPELGRHLERSIDTGSWCAYRPAEPVDWNF
jgi:tetratricopeptide (TPR) repeat protein